MANRITWGKVFAKGLRCVDLGCSWTLRVCIFCVQLKQHHQLESNHICRSLGGQYEGHIVP